ncbi:MAG TPA: lipase family protein [Pseudonocardiaceae bacterium]|nr:lipase family protein [Pseudonocardiaceae bacterium]
MRLPIRTGVTAAVAAAVVLIGTLAVGDVASASAAAGPTLSTPPAGAFYQPPTPLPAAPAGTVIRSEPVNYTGGTSGVTATRVMYLSEDRNNQPMPVTGTILVPNTPWTGSGARPIVGYAPMTAGLGPQCTVSETITGQGSPDMVVQGQELYINDLLAKGFAVAQTDYQGAGTPGPSTYLIRVPEAHAVLDAVRAAQRLSGSGLTTDGQVGITGYSQGGGAVAAAAELAPSYAPDLKLVGVAPGAPPADTLQAAQAISGNTGTGLMGFALIGVNQAYPQLNVLSRLNTQGLNAMRSLENDCVVQATMAYLFTSTSSWTTDGKTIPQEIQGNPDLLAAAKEQVIGNIRPAAPEFVESAINDDVVAHSVVTTMVNKWCSLGATVQYKSFYAYGLVTHAAAAQTTAPDTANWFAGRFAGTPAKSTC